MLKEIAFDMEERERRLRELIRESDLRLEHSAPEARSDPDLIDASGATHDPRYREVLEMSRSGQSEKEIVKCTGLTEGEISLIIELDRKRNESR